MSSSPYVDTWGAYLAAGWSPFPLPEGKKAAPPVGYTGAGAPRPDFKTCFGWADDTQNKTANIGVRMPDNVLGIDVDTYGTKRGDLELAAKITEWGPLPPTWRSSARDDPRSGVLVYRVPPELQYPSQLGSAIELLRPGHRYAVVAPSVRHDDPSVVAPAPWGAVYRWTHPDVDLDLVGSVPNVADLPELPAAWVQGLTAGVVADSSRPFARVAPPAELAAWRRADAGQQCPASQRLAASLSTGLGRDGGSRHDSLVNGMVALVKHGHEGHTGIPAACGVLAEAFRAAMTAPGSTRRYDPHEVDSATAWAVGALTGDRERVDPCSATGGVDAMINAAQRRKNRMLDGATAGVGPGSSTEPTGQATPPPAPAVPTGDFPVGALPEAVRPIVADLCRTGPDAAAALFAPQALAVLSAALGGHVWGRAGSEVTTLVTLYVATFSEAASGKSHGHTRLMTPLRAAIAQAVAAEEPGRRKRANQRSAAQARVDAEQRRYETAAKEWTDDTSRPPVQTWFDPGRDDASSALERAQEALDNLPAVAKWAPLISTNVTPEALIKRANQQGGVLAIMDDEPGSMATMTGYRYGGTADLEPLLHGYDGAEAKLVRKEAESAEIDSLRLTIGIMGQPGTRDGLLKLMNVEGRGLLARWLWSQVPDVAGLNDDERPDPDGEAGRRWDDLVARLVASGRANPGDVTVDLDRAATAVVKSYARQVRREQSRQDGLFGASSETRSWASRSVQLLVRLSVIFSACARPDDFRSHEVGEAEVLAALGVVTWARQQALALLAPAEHAVPTDPRTENAWTGLIEHEAVRDGQPFTLASVRDLLGRRLGEGRTKASAASQAAFLYAEVARGRLVELGRLRSGSGPRRAEHYRINSDAT